MPTLFKHNSALSAADFRVEGHACAVTLPVIHTLEEGIDFSPTHQAQAYFQQHYSPQITQASVDVAPNMPPLPQKS
ncbi:hypothetical protein C8N29_10964 [Agitococcus lubricus]|uniref:Uncharacterized protein n=1 Tax=Agitococcus lubricus TaxID=1077255 RepID=A0A2T5IYI1_9GAMM|nr:hypothetical protein C8N29_10964 [Agitococcus lubricus]